MVLAEEDMTTSMKQEGRGGGLYMYYRAGKQPFPLKAEAASSM